MAWRRQRLGAVQFVRGRRFERGGPGVGRALRAVERISTPSVSIRSPSELVEMPLPFYSDELGMRTLDPKCRSPSSSDARRTVVQLRNHQPQEDKANYMFNAVAWTLSNIVRCGLEANISANTRFADAEAQPLLVAASRRGNAGTLKVLLDGGADLTLTTSDGHSALGVASRYGFLDGVKLLLAAGANVNSAGPRKWTPLMEAVINEREGRVPILRALLDGGADLAPLNDDGQSALAVAARNGRLDCIRTLLAAGANANTRDQLGNTPLMIAILNKRLECVRALVPDSDLSLTNLQGQAAFHVCIVTGDEACLEILLPRTPDVDVRVQPGTDVYGKPLGTYHQTALHIACEKGQRVMAQALLRRGASRMARENSNLTPLHWAAFKGHMSCVILLVGLPGRPELSPAEVDATTYAGETALHFAAEGGHLNVCGVLIEAGARLDAKNARGITPLMLAQQFHPTNAELLALLSGGSDEPPGTMCDHCGKTAAQLARSLKVCGDCHSVRYCDAACLSAARRGHKKACKERVAERAAAVQATFLRELPTSP